MQLIFGEWEQVHNCASCKEKRVMLTHAHKRQTNVVNKNHRHFEYSSLLLADKLLVTFDRGQLFTYNTNRK